jgi:hypothetical protein
MDLKFIVALAPAVVAAVYTVAGYYRDRPMPNARPHFTMGILLVLTWAAVGFDYYDRHRAPTLDAIAQDPFATTEVNLQSIYGTAREPLYYSFNELGFPIHKLKEIKNKTFNGGTVPLDGYVYIGCSFTNVTFLYNGLDLTGGWVDAKKLDKITLVTNSAGLASYLAIGESLRIFPSDYCSSSSAPPAALSPK